MDPREDPWAGFKGGLLGIHTCCIHLFLRLLPLVSSKHLISLSLQERTGAEHVQHVALYYRTADFTAQRMQARWGVGKVGLYYKTQTERRRAAFGGGESKVTVYP